ncbi:MAG: class I SAM-dependent methyltransferase, partial [Alphaproteobacteria bacterium]
KPGDDHINYMLAVVLGAGAPSKLTPARVPLDLIRDHFDQVAKQYNQAVTMEGRTDHMQVATAARQAVQPGRIDHVVLDLGAGTGICGSQLRDIASEITGVDISAPMLHQAELLQHESGRKLYDKLIHREALEFLATAQEKTYDIVLVSGLTHYLGDLNPLFTEVARVLKSGGIMAFASCRSPGGAIHFNAEQEMFCYSQDYLEKMAHAVGLHISQMKEMALMPGQPGWIGVCTKA